jgi:TolB protein
MFALLLAPQALAAEETSTALVAFTRLDHYPYGAGDLIMVMNPDGSGMRAVLDGVDPRWSPDGTRIASWSYDDREDFDTTISIYDLVQERTLTTVAKADDPSWSPDGSKVVFVSERFNPETRLDEEDIFVMDADGSNKTNLTNSPNRYSDPAWSSTGKIAFTRHDPEKSRVYVMDASPGSEQVPIGPIGSSHPTWNPEGTRVAFTCCVYERADSEIYLIDSDGSDLVQLTDNDTQEGSASWSPNGDAIYYASHGDVHVLDLDRRRSRRLTCVEPGYESYTSPDFRPGTWSPQAAGKRRAETDVHVYSRGRARRDNRRVLAVLEVPRGPCDPPRDTCMGGRRVIVKEALRGGDRVVRRGVSNDDGRFNASVEQRGGRFYAIVHEKRYTSPAGRPVHCLAGRSPTTFIDWR